MKKVLKDLTNGDNLDLIKDLVPEEFISEDALKDEIDKLLKDKKDIEKAKELEAIREKSKILKKEQEDKEAKEKENKYKLENTTKIEEYKTTYNEFDKMLKDIKMYTEKGSGKITPTDIGQMKTKYETYIGKINQFKSPDSTTINVDDKTHGLIELKDWKGKLKDFYNKYEKLYQQKVIDKMDSNSNPVDSNLSDSEIEKYKKLQILLKDDDQKDDVEDKIKTIDYLKGKVIDLGERAIKNQPITRSVAGDLNDIKEILDNKENYEEFIKLYNSFVNGNMNRRKKQANNNGFRFDL